MPAESGRAGSTPLVVALLGPAGAGKSRVREALAERGAAQIDFDAYSRDLLQPGTPQYEAVAEQFGSGYLRADGSVDRAALAEPIFRDARQRRRLNAIVHPAMIQRLREAVAGFRAAPAGPALVVEGAILGRLPVADLFEATVVVQAPADLREQRLVQGKGLSPEQARRRIAVHEELGLGCEPADWVLVNDADPAALQQQVNRLWQWLLDRSQQPDPGT